MQCAHCGTAMTEQDAYCTECGARLGATAPGFGPAVTADATTGTFAAGALDVIRRPENVLRALSAGLLIGGLVLAFSAGGAWFLILIPVLIGLFLPLLQIPSCTDRINHGESALASRRARAQQSEGKFASFFRRPFYACAAGIWHVSQAISNPHVRAAARLTMSLYLLALFAVIFVVGAYVIVAIVALIAVLALIGWILSLNDRSSGRVTGRRVRDWFGDERIEYTDGRGRKVGESRETTDLSGNPRVEHFDAAGRKSGESRQEANVFGGEKTVHYDRSGARAGSSREEADVLGSPQTVHYDPEGRKSGESRPGKDLFGDDVIEHFDSSGKKTGETQ